MGNKTDLRVIKTKATIRKAFLDLLKEKDFDNIMISDITNAAMINRGTFYLHYKDKYDLMESLENEMIEKLEQFADLLTPESIQESQKEKKPLPHLIPALQYLQENGGMFQLVSRRENNDPFFRKISTIFFNKMQECFNLDLNDEFKGYRTDVSIAAAGAVMNRWVNEEDNINKDRLALYLSRIVLSAMLVD